MFQPVAPSLQGKDWFMQGLGIYVEISLSLYIDTNYLTYNTPNYLYYVGPHSSWIPERNIHVVQINYNTNLVGVQEFSTLLAASSHSVSLIMTFSGLRVKSLQLRLQADLFAAL